MDYLALFGIAVGLSMDAFAVALTNGAVTRNLKLKHALGIALAFGAFQAVMPTIGWLVGIAGRGIIESVDHWVAFILLGYIGGKMVYDAVKEAKSHEPKECRDPISFKMLMVMAIATSIDALATGIILPSVVGASTLLLMLTAVGLDWPDNLYHFFCRRLHRKKVWRSLLLESGIIRRLSADYYWL